MNTRHNVGFLFINFLYHSYDKKLYSLFIISSMKKIIVSIFSIICIIGLVLGYVMSHKSMELPQFIEKTLHAFIPSSDQDILFEFRLPKATYYDSEVYFECITNDLVAPVFMEKAQVRTVGEYLVFSGNKTDTCIISSDDTKIAGIISQNGKPSQVFVIDRNLIPLEDWSEWNKPTYTDGSEDVKSAFLNTYSGSVSTTIPADSFEMRYKISKHLFRSDAQYAEMTKEQKTETVQDIKDIRKNIATGNTE